MNILNNKQIGLLELGGGYTNVGGLCTYGKFNFKISNKLFGEDCFRDYENIPMESDISNITQGTIINIVKGLESPFQKHFLCDYNKTKEKQYILGMLLNLQMVIYNNIYDELKADSDDYEYVDLWEIYFNKNKNKLRKITDEIINNRDNDNYIIDEELKKTIEPTLSELGMDTNISLTNQPAKIDNSGGKNIKKIIKRKKTHKRKKTNKRNKTNNRNKTKRKNRGKIKK